MAEFAAALVGAVVGGSIALIGVQLQIRHQARMEDERRFRDSLERLYEVLSNAYDRATMLLQSIDAGRSLIDSREIAQFDIGLMHMIVSYYVPELKKEAAEIERGLEGMLSAWGKRDMWTDDLDAARREALFREGCEAGGRAQEAIKRAREKLGEIVPPYNRLRS
ncbi:protein of unknown function [Candidatus Filomicrobium marinum]|uniref:Uncharacterized protein n=1 Tax=Candidatus Filomicrobium marinum TaxID=1608628 RepID=A0A0D6JIM1_9HYPH|nr:hypothetical protein [Candidatus Filomicrobium marinum]CFX34627.1 protein of unknown function [Candidatus Filomicrobium marinum]CPR21849.1 protein of unknown function [Candidatus Filomicrobium marinum]